VVIPAYNEALRIQPYLTSVVGYLDQCNSTYEILVVDDGSQDCTGNVVREFSRHASGVRLIVLEHNLGKGAAVRSGMLQARGELILMADADGATPITELRQLEEAIVQGSDIAIGSRFLASRDRRYVVEARWHRSILGNCFNSAVQRLGVSGITDTQCGFKLFRHAVAQDLFSVSCINGYGIDLEILYVAQRRRYRISEIPVNWADQPGTKVRVLQDGLVMLSEMLTVRHNYKRGFYDLPPLSVTPSPSF
jgi:dolichyl-phosphate beta-glucosyltransferase